MAESSAPPPEDLFTGTAEYYARYRLDYPDAIYEALERAFPTDGSGTLLDLGTGTGQMALHLASRFARVVALDVSAEMVEAGRAVAQQRGIANIEWHVLPAEELGRLGPGPYRLVTIASAFHWMDQPRVLELAYDRTEPGGGIFITGLPGFFAPDNIAPNDTLAAVIAGVISRYLGERRRAGSGYFAPPPRRWEDWLADSRYVDVEVGYHHFTAEFDLDAIVGLLYSTSFANHRLLGDRVEAFEADLRHALLELNPAGRYTRAFDADWALAYRR